MNKGIKKVLNVPEGVDVAIEDFKVKTKGPKGELERDFFDPKYAKKIKIEASGNQITVSSKTKRKKFKAMVGTIASHIKNMIAGVTKGFRYRLKIVYAHFPITVSVEGDRVVIKNFLGEKSNRYSKIIGATKVTVKGQEILVEGIDKEQVSQTAANIENTTRVVGKDRRVFSDGIFIVSKAEDLDEEKEVEEASRVSEQTEKKEER